MTLVAAMLCGVPCVATGMGAQGEVIGHYGVAIEAGSAPAFVKGIQRVLQLTPEKRAAMAQGARKHALANYVYVKSLQRYLQLYYDLIGRQSLVSQEMPTPEIDASVPVPAKVGATADKKKPLVTMAELSDPDSLEAKVTEHSAQELPKWRLEQEQERSQARTGPVATDRREAVQRRRAAGLRSRDGEADEHQVGVLRSARAAWRTRAKNCCRWMRLRRSPAPPPLTLPPATRQACGGESRAAEGRAPQAESTEGRTAAVELSPGAC